MSDSCGIPPSEKRLYPNIKIQYPRRLVPFVCGCAMISRPFRLGSPDSRSPRILRCANWCAFTTRHKTIFGVFCKGCGTHRGTLLTWLPIQRAGVVSLYARTICVRAISHEVCTKTQALPYTGKSTTGTGGPAASRD